MARASYPEAVLSDRPIVLFRFEETGEPTDGASLANAVNVPQAGLSAGKFPQGIYRGKPTVATGALAVSEGEPNRAARFSPDAPSAFEAPVSATWDAVIPFAIELWVRPQPSPASAETRMQCLVAQVDPATAGNIAFGLWYEPNAAGSAGRIRFGTPAHADGMVDHASEITAGRFTHVVVTCEPNGSQLQVRLFLDGVPSQPRMLSDRVSPRQAGPWIFGAVAFDSAAGVAAQPFAGELDEVAVYQHVLPPARVRDHFYRAGPVPKFEAEIHPLLTSHCMECHGGDDAEGGLDVQTLTSMLRGGASGPALVPGNPDQSILVDMVTHGDMPPGENRKLSAAQVDLLRRWIALGAPHADGKVSPELATAHLDEGARSPHWAFQLLHRPPVPQRARMLAGNHSPAAALGTPPTDNAAEIPQHPIDAFILEKLLAQGLSMSPAADRARLARRMYFDLLGIPPTPEQLDAFLADETPDATARLIELLLASPQFGVRWGRHWLDMVGYTDTISFDSDFGPPGGFLEGKWRYRDYVVQSFNRDKPFDVAVRQQLAGDEMVPWRDAQGYTEEIVEHLTATGYWRCAEDVTGEDGRPFTVWSVLHDNMTQVGMSLMGLSLNCARCHSHKYEPISQQDYYSLMAFVTPAMNPQAWKTPQERALPDVSATDRAAIDQWNDQIAKKVQPVQEELDTIRRPYTRQLREMRFSKLDAVLRAELWVALETPEEKRTQVQIARLGDNAQIIAVTDDDLRAVYAPADAEKAAALQQQIATMNQARRSHGWIHAMYDVGPAPATQLLQMGSHEYPRREVPVAYLRTLRSTNSAGQIASPPTPSSSGRRLALAHWLTDSSSPASALVARVMVNRVWERLMGEGLVTPSENMGQSGSAPSHPELLEWLTTDFVEHGWSMKHLVQRVMTSAVYQQASFRDATQATALALCRERDPENRLLWRARLRRIDSEVVRDAILTASDQLNVALGGPPVPLEYRPDGYVSEAKQGLARPSDRWRRSLYLLNRRLNNPTFLAAFDKPIVTGCVGRRDDAAVPLQSLAMMNDELVLEQAERFAVRVIREAGGAPLQQIQRAYRIVFGRPPTGEEVTWSRELMQQQALLFADDSAKDTQQREVAALAALCQTLLSTSEFLYLE